MKTSKCFLFVSFLILSMPQSARAQVSPGLPPLNDFSNGKFDIVNIGSRNILFSIPIRAKAGAIPFSAELIWNNSMAYNGRANAWAPPASLFSATAGGNITFTTTYQSCGTDLRDPVYSSFFYIDSTQTLHPFSVLIDAERCIVPSGTSSGVAQDGSGYYLTVHSGGGAQAQPTEDVWDISGMHVFAGINGSAVVTDPNGNSITCTYSGTSGTYGNCTDTLGQTVLTVARTGTGPTTYSYTDAAGGARTVIVNYSSYTEQTNFGCAAIGPHEFGPQPNTLLPSNISMPDGSSYQITYETTPGFPSSVTGRIAKITLPTGGSISYSYTGGNNNSGMECSSQYLPILTRTLTNLDGSTAVWKYDGQTLPAPQVLVTDPYNNETVYTFGAATPNYGELNHGFESRKLIYSGPHSTGTLLQTVVTCYNGNTTNCATTSPGVGAAITEKDTTTTIAGMTTSSQSKLTFNSNGLLITRDREYDFGSSTPTTDRMLTYGSYSGGSCLSLGTYINNRVCGAVTKNGTGTVFAQTNYTYDANGNLTQTSRWTGGTTYVNSYTSYNSNGTVHTTTDARGAITTLNYDGSCNSLFPTGTTLPAVNGITQTVSQTWDCGGGVVTSSTDANGRNTTYSYVNPSTGLGDPFWRQTQIGRPDGGSTTTTYNTGASLPWSVSTSTAIFSSMNLTSTSIHDGFGREMQSQLTSDPDGVTYVDTTYDALGRKATVSNPHRSGSSTTDGITTYFYDALSRVISVAEPDNSHVSTAYGGNCNTVTDEAGNTGKFCVDGLGRLAAVWEDPGSSPHKNYETDYGYDALGNLLSVTQKGGATSGSWRTRSFAYDALSRLTSATNPESGSVSYTYDNNSNVQTKVAAKPNQTGAATVTTTFSYDALNRLTQKSYNDSLTPTVSYGYDGLLLSCATPIGFIGGAAQNELGRRSSLCWGTGSKSWQFDAMGRPKNENQRQIGTTNLLSSNTVYGYYLDGAQLEAYYPSSPPTVELIWGRNAAGSMVTVQDAQHYFLRNGHYTPGGSLATANFNGANTISNTYNKRLQPVTLTAATSTGTSLLNLTYDFHLGAGDNGNVFQIANGRDATRTQNFTYDALNRIKQANTTSTTGAHCWGEAYTIDAWGNLTNRAGVAGMTGCQTEGLSTSATLTNRLSGFTYDAAGNLMNDGVHNYTYDAENRILNVDGTAWTYTYDSDGQRVKKCTGSPCTSGTVYFRNVGDGSILQESNLAGTFQNAYATLGGRVIGRVDLPANTPNFYLANQLGSTSVIVNASGTITKEADYFPYGGEIPITSGDSNRYKFTGKERDAESGLDDFGARYDSGSLGRFMSPDPGNAGVTNADPQSWNAYAYVRNNPVSLIDPSGKVFCRPASESEQQQGITDGICDLTDSDYVNSTKEQQKAYDQEGYKHYDCSCDTGGDKDAWQHPNGNISTDYVGNALVFAAAYAGVEALGALLHDIHDSERLPQDVKRQNNYPDPPSSNGGSSPIGTNPNQKAALARDIQQARQDGATDIRSNQEQVNGEGVRVGQNRPDLQYTERNGVRHYIEYDQDPASGAAHKQRISANDPAGVVETKTVK